MKNIILASGSPRRKELMERLDVDFEVIVANVDESLDKTLPIEKALIKLANKKAKAVFKDYRDSIVIGADSIVFQNDVIFNKPKDKEDAYQMIKAFSNNHHLVLTAVSIIDKSQTVNFITKCKVYFNEISHQEINEYLKSDEYRDKAGAYAIQGLMSKFIYKVEGDYYAVVGFPVAEIYSVLRDDFNVYSQLLNKG
ncbi:MAG: septum formation protein Maf [Erysipelothrix sp.]|nr:septum formation protein Maf [Erysipelothrix sp.]